MKVSILSQRASRGDQIVKLGGKIRPGIKVLTRAASENDTARKIYNEGVAKRLKFSEIEKLIKDATGMSNPMYPNNTQYFTVAASDFGMPEIATLIINKYGEVRGDDQVKRLYRFPVVFHSDDLNEVYPNEFRRYGGEPGYESHYGEDGNRYCRYLPEVTPEMLAEQNARRIKRPPRREKVIRGLCDPATCTEALLGQCKFYGRLRFYIPGIPTTGLVGLDTTSGYAADAIWAELDRIRNTFGGIPRTNPNKPGSVLFWITKVQEPRTFYDANGQKKRGLQWVPALKADIDVGNVLLNGHLPQLANHAAPVAWLGAPKGMPQALTMETKESTAGPVTPTRQGTQERTPETQASTGAPAVDQPMDQLMDVLAQMGIGDELAADYFDLKLGKGWENDDDKIKSGVDQLVSLGRVGNACALRLIEIAVKATAIGIPQPEFQKYATMKYGRGFTNKEAVLTAICNELDEFSKSNVESVLAYIKAQTENAAVAS